MAKMQITSDENIREALRRFKKMCDKEGFQKKFVAKKVGGLKILRDLKNSSFPVWQALRVLKRVRILNIHHFRY